MAKKVFEVDAKCKACGGTGLYVGMCERDGAAVVCSRCKGKGHFIHRLEWEEFEKRKRRKNIKRVYQTSAGICIGENKTKNLSLEDFGGMSYFDWLKGKDFPSKSENRNFVCPAWWYQSTNYKLKPHWDECCSFGAFSSCSHFKVKQKCWRKWDKEYGEINDEK